MAKKDINIHVKAPGAEQSKQKLDSVAAAGRNIGNKTAAGQKQAADATKKTSQNLTGMGRILGLLKTQVAGFLAAWLGLQTVIKLVNFLIERLERISQLQKEIYDSSVSLSEVGQALEFQTGTVGKQQFWAGQAGELQKTGGLKPGVAGKMLTSLDIALSAQGGIKNEQVRQLGKDIAPFIGTAGIGGEEVSKLFEFAGTAGVAPTADSYRQYFAKLQAAYTAGKPVDFGQFMMGLQKGGTAYMAKGGTFEEATSLFIGARAVSSSEALAATSLEQVARIAGGGYEKPRLAMEKGLGVKWSDLSMDQRTSAMLEYVESIPESQRTQTLVKQGFPPELTSVLEKMVTPEAKGATTAARQKVSSATTMLIDEQTQAYLDSILGKKRALDAESQLKDVELGPKIRGWQERLEAARIEFKELEPFGEDRFFIKNTIEPQLMAMEKLLAEVESYEPTTEEQEKKHRNLIFHLGTEVDAMGDWLYTHLFTKGKASVLGQRYTQQWENLQQGSVIINDHSINNYPTTGDDGRGPRFTDE